MKKYKLIKEYPTSPYLGVEKHIDELTFWPANWPDFWQEIKEPLFVTEDGVEIFENDSYYMCDLDFSIKKYTTKMKYDYDKSIERFSSKEAAEKWIEQNKPKFSIKQINNVINDCDYSTREFLKKELGI